MTASVVRPAPFIGRVEEVIEIGRLLRATRLLTLTGPPGAGKSRLAREVADRYRQSGGDVVVAELSELRGLADSAVVTASITAALGTLVDAEAGGPDRLLVLDGGDHLLDVCAPVLAALLVRRFSMRVLATGIEAFRLPGEMVFSVPGLSLPDGSGRFEPRSDAVRLYAERARAADPAFELTEENLGDVAAVCAGLDGQPLAVELAAGLVRTLPPADLRSRLDDRLDLLVRPGGPAGDRQRSLRTAFDGPWRLLTPPQRLLFERLSVLTGEFTAEAAAAVGGGDGVPPTAVPLLLVTLEAKSLLVSQPDGAGRARLRMLGSTRAYAAERAAGDGLPAIRERAVAWLAGLAAPLSTATLVPDATVASLVEQRHQLATALDWLAGGSDERQLLLGAALAWAEIEGGRPLDAGRRLAAALQRADRRCAHRGVALDAAAALAGPGAAAAMLDEAIEGERAGGSAAVLGRLLLHRAGTHTDPAPAVADLRECLAVVADTGTAAAAGGALARVLLGMGEPGAAAAALSAAFDQVAGSGAPAWVPAFLHTTAGMVALERGEPRAAEAAFTEAYAPTGRLPAEAVLRIGGLARVAARTSRPEAALRLYGLADSAAAAGTAGVAGVAGAAGVTGVPGWWRDRVARAAARSRRALPVQRVHAALAAGRAVPPGEALARSWQLLHPAPGEPAVRDLLSPREHEVVALVVGGLTNRQIAARLLLSVRTVETHVSHVRSVLGLRSRSHLAAWATQRAVERLPDAL